ncbi:MAG: Jag N-terminal domain-containing protein [Clostridia bacterium]|nr:Jag N-terminal domain-containing protein [Clostridia bacterium]MDD4375306.1 Jag N-terminal domain-containing protein [Clostridia bacterium]
MKRVTEQVAKTVEEAVRKGLEELKVPKDYVKIEVLEEPSKSVMGFLSSNLARVRLIVDRKLDDATVQATAQKADAIVSKVFEIMKDESKYDIKNKDGKVEVIISNKDSAHLIGYKGRTIEAFQSTINSILQKDTEENAKVFIEVNDYKKNKEEKLKNLANKMADNVVRFKKIIKLEPMSAYERMIVHTALSGRKDIETESIGEEPRRRIMIKIRR